MDVKVGSCILSLLFSLEKKMEIIVLETSRKLVFGCQCQFFLGSYHPKQVVSVSFMNFTNEY